MKTGIGITCTVAALAVILMQMSCSRTDVEKDKVLVINEVVASNRSGLMTDDGELLDWVEIKNVSDGVVSLKGYSLEAKKAREKKAGKKEKKGKQAGNDVAKADIRDTVPPTVRWDFPEKDIRPGECLVVFVDKDADPDTAGNGQLMANFKLDSKKNFVRLVKDDDVVAEAEFDNLSADQCLRRMTDGTYEKSYLLSPGKDNDNAGYEAYNALIEKQRADAPLKVWRVKTKSAKSYLDWVSVKNVSPADVNLREYFLATKPDKPEKWRFPEKTLRPGQTYTVRCGDDEDPGNDSFHFGNSETVLITHDGEFIDGLCAKPAPAGVTMGRAEGRDGFFFYPDAARRGGGQAECYRFIAPMPRFVTKPGIYNDSTSMTVAIDTHGYTVRYTTTGSEPSPKSTPYESALSIDTTTVLRAYCEGDSVSMRSDVATGTYFLHENHTLPVMNISVDPADLYDYRNGIYMKGPGAEKEYPYYGANYWKPGNWKRAHVEFYEGDDSCFAADCGLAIFGGFSRTLAKKSFKLKFKEVFGPSSVTYDFFGHGTQVKLKNLVLRSGSQDMGGVMVRDEFFTSLMKANSPTLLVQDNRPVVLYVNGHYFGIYYIREKIDRHFVARHLNVSNDLISIFQSKFYTEEGSSEDYKRILAYVSSHDMTQRKHYDWVSAKVDLESLIDFKLGEMYSGNADVGNVRYVRSLDKGCDHKWYHVYYDLDAAWITFQPMSFYLSTTAENKLSGSVGIHNVLINRMLTNPYFRQLFLQRLSMHMHKTFSAGNATRVFDALIAAIKPEMPRNCQRWPGLLKYDKWEQNVAEFRQGFSTRAQVMLNDLRQELSITDAENRKYFADLGF